MEANKFETMGKEALRQACRDAGISYAKLNNDGMRAALTQAAILAREAKMDDAEIAAWNNGSATPEAPEGEDLVDLVEEEEVSSKPSIFAALLNPQAVKVHNGQVTKIRDGKKVVEPAPIVKAVPKASEPKVEIELQGYNHTGVHKCPECGVVHDQTWANEGVSLFCHHCSTTYSATTGRKIRAGHTRPNASKGYTIEKDRPEQNGVKRPSVGTVCGTVWAEFDANPTIAAKELPALADKHGWNKNNVSCEFYAWRKFNGIKGRQA